MISDFREGGSFSKIGDSLSKKAFSIGGKSEIGGRGGQKWPQKIGYHLWTAPFEFLQMRFKNNCSFLRLEAEFDLRDPEVVKQVIQPQVASINQKREARKH